MNSSVSSFAPKNRTFSRMMSLTTRVFIVGAVQLLGHHKYWKLVLERQEIKMSGALKILLRRKGDTNYYTRDYSKDDTERKMKV